MNRLSLFSSHHHQDVKYILPSEEQIGHTGLSPIVPVDFCPSRRYKLHQRHLRITFGGGGNLRHILDEKQGTSLNAPSIQLEHNDYASPDNCAPLATYCVLTPSPLVLERYVSDGRGKICATILKSGDQDKCKYRICAPPKNLSGCKLEAVNPQKPCLLAPLAEAEAFVRRAPNKSGLDSRSSFRWSWSKFRSMKRKSRPEKGDKVDPSSVADLYPSGSVLEMRMTMSNGGKNEIYSANHAVLSIVRQTQRPPNGCTIWRINDPAKNSCDSSLLSSTSMSSLSGKENCARLTLCSGTERELWVRQGVDPCLMLCFVAILDEVMFEICYDS